MYTMSARRAVSEDPWLQGIKSEFIESQGSFAIDPLSTAIKKACRE